MHGEGWTGRFLEGEVSCRLLSNLGKRRRRRRLSGGVSRIGRLPGGRRRVRMVWMSLFCGLRRSLPTSLRRRRRGGVSSVSSPPRGRVRVRGVWMSLFCGLRRSLSKSLRRRRRGGVSRIGRPPGGRMRVRGVGMSLFSGQVGRSSLLIRAWGRLPGCIRLRIWGRMCGRRRPSLSLGSRQRIRLRIWGRMCGRRRPSLGSRYLVVTAAVCSRATSRSRGGRVVMQATR